VTVYAAATSPAAPIPTRAGRARPTPPPWWRPAWRGSEAVVLTLGDHTYPHGTAAEFANCYGPDLGPLQGPHLALAGQPRVLHQGRAPYFAYFGARAGRGYYSLRLGSWLIVFARQQPGRPLRTRPSWPG
jgi:hypothetical protein